MGTTNNIPAKTPRKSSLSRFAEALAKSCRKHLLREKWLLAPSYRVGQQWLDVVARNGQPVVNVRLKTLPALALELAGPSLAQDNRQLVSPLGRAIILGEILSRLRSDEPYLARVAPSLGMAERLAASVHDVRLADLESSQLRLQHFEVAAKGRELLALLHDYSAELQARHLADEADVLRMALSNLPRLPGDVLVLLPTDLERSRLEQTLLEAIPRGQLETLAVDESSSASVEVVSAVGEVNEVRAVLRRCLAEKLPFDHVELLHTDAGTFVPLIYELTERLGVPVTFAEGIPVQQSRPGRALASWLGWIADGFPQRRLVSMIQDGLLNSSTAAHAGVLRAQSIGFGRDRYLPLLNGELRSLVAEWLQVAADRNRLRASARFLTEQARCASELDNYAREALLLRIGEMARWINDTPSHAVDLREWLRSLVREVRVLGLGPRPGSLHVAGVHTGGHSGRLYTFIVGLDADRFPGAGYQDPVLLDTERRQLSPHLRTAAETRANVHRDFERLLARLRGQVVLSCSQRHLEDDRESFPSAVVNVPAKAPPASFAPSDEQSALDEAEWWLWRVCVKRTAEAMDAVARRFPHLGRGLEAERQRAGEVFTAYDGFVPKAGADLDPTLPGGRVLSARSLEALGACPRRFFYRYALGLELPDELELDPNRWLPTAEFGKLMHEVFYALMKYGRDNSEEHITAYRETFPPPSEGVFRRECRQLQRAIRTFLASEKQLGNAYRPAHFEVNIEDAPLALPDGAMLRVRGRLDRVDEIGDALAIWDYKSGGTSRFTKSRDPFHQGRVLQHALYIALAEWHFKKPVSEFGYVFPGERGRGDRLRYQPTQLAGAPQLFARLCRLMATGAFTATNKIEDCRTCDYCAVCGDVAEVTDASARKLAGAANPVLRHFRELRT